MPKNSKKQTIKEASNKDVKKQEIKEVIEKQERKTSTIDKALENIIKENYVNPRASRITINPFLETNDSVQEKSLEVDLAKINTPNQNNTINNNNNNPNISYAVNDNYGNKSGGNYDSGYPKEVSNANNPSLQNQFMTSSMQAQEKGMLRQSDSMGGTTTGYPEEKQYVGSEPEKKKRNGLW